ncbi:type II secretion system protein GspL [Allohahella marinimesophila]|uniref:GspL periplasmic domain-containing protein n=1 Tax=Allohahella marinimesophila TaxID=1054972 RepID=A0ABP7QAA1_9GAMM
MSIQLFVRPVDPYRDQLAPVTPKADAEQVYEWALVDFSGHELSAGVDTFEGIMQLSEQQNLDDALLSFIMPSQHFGYVLAKLTPKQARYMQQALPFAVEELIAEDIESVHLVADARVKLGDESGFPTWVCRRNLFESFYNEAMLKPVPLDSISCEAAIVIAAHDSIVKAAGDDPEKGQHIHLFFDQLGASVGDDGFANSLPVNTLICAPGRLATSVPAESVELVIDSLNTFGQPESSQSAGLSATVEQSLQDAEPDELGLSASGSDVTLHITISDAMAERYALLLTSLESHPGFTVKMHRHQASPFTVLCDYATRFSVANFCSGPYKAQADGRSTGLSQWKPVAMAAGLVFLVLLGFNGVRGFFYEQQAQQLQQESLALYKSIFPADRRVSNPRRQMEGRLRSANTSSAATDFLQMLGEAGFRLSTQPNSSSMSFSNLQYNAQRGELAVEVRAAALGQIDQYKTALDQAGYQVDIGSAIKEANGVRGKITLRGAPGA